MVVNPLSLIDHYPVFSKRLAIYRCIRTYPVRRFGAWRVRRSGIKGEPAGRRTAAELFTPSAKACTELTLKARHEYFEAYFQSVLGH